MRRVLSAPLLLSLLVTGLSGCAASRHSSNVLDVANETVAHRQETIRHPTRDSSSFVVEPTFYAARKPLAVKHIEPTEQLPPAFHTREISVQEKGQMSIDELTSLISEVSGTLVTVLPDVYDIKTADQARTPAAAAPAPVIAGAAGDPSAPPSLPPLPMGGTEINTQTGAAIQPAGRPSETLSVQGFQYRGSVAGLLESLAGRFNLSWRWTGEHVEIYRYETRRFLLNALAGSSNSSSTLSLSASTSTSGGSSGGTSGSTGQSVSTQTNMDIWGDVEKAIEGVLSEGGSFSMVPSAGMVTVRDRPSVLRVVEAHISEFNRIFSRQVAVHVEIYAVERRDQDQYGIDWQAFWSRASSNYGFSLTSGLNNTAGTGGGTFGPTFTLDFTDPNSAWTGSNAIFTALSTLGRTSLLTSGTAISLNGQAVPFNVSRERAYLAEYSTNISGGDTGTVTTTLTPEIITEGFSMNFLPRVLDDNTVLLRYSVDLAAIEGIETFETPDGNAAIQLPQRSIRNFLQNVTMRSGETLVLTGYQQVSASKSSNGPLSGNAWMLGGSKNDQLSTVTVVITVTPYVTQSQ